MTRAPASISLDLDNQWAYMKTHGDEWKSFPGYLDLVVPRILDFLRQQELQITFFVVGQDAALERNHAALKSIAEAGHEIGNHSFRHEPWLHLYGEDELVHEIQSAEEAIYEATGKRPVGFRGPGFSFTRPLLNLLAERGYLYDASTFPTFLGPVARAYYFYKSRFNRSEKSERKELFGKFANGFRSNRPYWWQLESQQRLLEMPVTTMPIFKLPFHASYLGFLAGYSTFAARSWFGLADRLCRWTGVQPSLLLHPTDFLDASEIPEMAFFPGMQVAASAKQELLRNCIAAMGRHRRLVTMQEHATIAMNSRLTTRDTSGLDMATS